MIDLIELVNLIHRTKLKTNGLLNLILEPGSKMELLFESIATEEVSTDDEAKVLLYGEEEDASGYSNLKYKLKERLLDSIFLLDYKGSSYTNREKAFLDCYKRWAGAMILLIRKQKINGIDQLEKLLRHTIKFEFTELNLDILRVLRLQYSTVDGDFKKYEQTREQYRIHEKIWMMESKAEDYYSDLMIQYTNSKSSNAEVTERAKAYYEELEPFMKECSSFKLHLFGRMIHLLIYNSEYDYVTTAKLCEDAIAFFNQKEYHSGLPLQVFYYNLIVCYLQLKEFEKGEAMIEETLAMFETGSFNWFKLQELFFLLAMHTAHYDEAYRIFEQVTNHSKFASQMPHIVEMWGIFQAYLHYLVKVDKIHLSEEQTSNFRLSKVLNDLVVYAKDKGGMNISIQIIQILYSLAEKNYEKTAERIDSTQKYLTRYLKAKDTVRSYNFIKMLLQLPDAQYHREAVARKTAKFYSKLQAVPLEVANQTHEVEIIPYEALWEMTIESLDLKFIKTKGSD
jgi:hypothetical protein